MATWAYVQKFVRDNFKTEDVGDTGLRLLFGFEDGRSQMVFVAYVQAGDGGDWLHVESPVGAVADVNLQAALSLVENMAIGGLSRVGDFVTIRHAQPLENVDQNEIVDPIRIIALLGDKLEKALTGGDRF